MLTIGPFSHPSRVIVAPMAGVTDQPFRNLCREHGAYWLVSEMVTSETRLWQTKKSENRLRFHDEREPRWVQIAGADPVMMADAAVKNVALGAQIIDINMGCPAKKVCNKLAGSSLLKDEVLVGRILEAVVAAVDVPVTLKMRLGWSREKVNALTVAAIAEQSGVQLITLHGRTREDRFKGSVDYDTIGCVKQAVSIPVIANGDITSPDFAHWLLEQYALDGIMAGRGVQGRPWLPAQIDAYINGAHRAPPPETSIVAMLLSHVASLCAFYGEYTGVRVARKHVGWTLSNLVDSEPIRRQFNKLDSLKLQTEFLSGLTSTEQA